VLADLAVGLHLLGFLLPFGGALQAMAVTPFAALAARHRARALLVGACCGAGVAFLVGGLHLSLWVMASGLIGLALGWGYRGGWGWTRTTASAAILAGSLLAGVTAATLALLPHLRRLSLAQVHIAWRGVARLLDHVGLSALTGPLTTAVDGVLRWWWVTLPALEVVAVGAAAVVARALALPALGRLMAAVGPPALPLPLEEGQAGPVPAELEHVSHRYAGADRPALSDLSVRVERGRLTTVVGPNGSGKSTLARVLLGMPPTAGRVRRPGVAGLGRPGGTTLISQRPESQVLGVRVGDDISWGAGSTSAAEVARVLAAVGLEGAEHQETATLSGGQLQRLAIAAALSRRPALLVSDESTSMLDPPGQQEVLAVLRRLVDSEASTVVHVTHQPTEVDGTAVIALEEAGWSPARRSVTRSPAPARALGARTTAGPRSQPPFPTRRWWRSPASATCTPPARPGPGGPSRASPWRSPAARSSRWWGPMPPGSPRWRGCSPACSSQPRVRPPWRASRSRRASGRWAWRSSTHGCSCFAPAWRGT
jgi:energy-coupling factor transporter ATP-binding protein EcfA2